MTGRFVVAPVGLRKSELDLKGWDQANSWFSEEDQSFHVHLTASRRSMVLGQLPNATMVPAAPRLTSRIVGRYRWKATSVR